MAKDIKVKEIEHLIMATDVVIFDLKDEDGNYTGEEFEIYKGDGGRIPENIRDRDIVLLGTRENSIEITIF